MGYWHDLHHCRGRKEVSVREGMRRVVELLLIKMGVSSQRGLIDMKSAIKTRYCKSW